MSDQEKIKPHIFFAFANDWTHSRSNLRDLKKEYREIQKTIETVIDKDKCGLLFESGLTSKRLLDTFQQYEDTIVIFHYAGHADSYSLLLESAQGKPERLYRKQLVATLSRQHSLQFVF